LLYPSFSYPQQAPTHSGIAEEDATCSGTRSLFFAPTYIGFLSLLPQISSGFHFRPQVCVKYGLVRVLEQNLFRAHDRLGPFFDLRFGSTTTGRPEEIPLMSFCALFDLELDNLTPQPALVNSVSNRYLAHARLSLRSPFATTLQEKLWFSSPPTK